jgi:hypothetical protein
MSEVFHTARCHHIVFFRRRQLLPAQRKTLEEDTMKKLALAFAVLGLVLSAVSFTSPANADVYLHQANTNEGSNN